jgi:hypothetical protein
MLPWLQGRDENLVAVSKLENVLMGSVSLSFDQEKLYFSSMSFNDTQTRIINELDLKTTRSKELIKLSCNDQLEFLQSNDKELSVFVATGLNSNSVNFFDLKNRSIPQRINLTSDLDEKFVSTVYRPVLFNNRVTVFSVDKSDLLASWPLEPTLNKRKVVTLAYRLIDFCFDSASGKTYLLQASSTSCKLRVDVLDMVSLKVSDGFEMSVQEIGSGFRSSYSGLRKLTGSRIAVWFDYSKGDSELKSLLLILDEKAKQVQRSIQMKNIAISDVVASPTDVDKVYAAMTYCTDGTGSSLHQGSSTFQLQTCLRSNIFSLRLNTEAVEIPVP